MNGPIAIFVDFDGTIAKADVGYRLFHHFSNGRNETLIPAWKSGSMSSRQILQAEAEMVRGTREQLLAFCDQFTLDPDWGDFVTLARISHIPLQVCSDGLSFYIEYLLQRYGFADLEVTANRGVSAGDRLHVEFPFLASGCGRCGNCKGARIRQFRAAFPERRQIVFVGDGYSDLCAAAEADILYAKSDLAAYCAANGIAYTPFRTFADVAQDLIRRGVLQPA